MYVLRLRNQNRDLLVVQRLDGIDDGGPVRVHVERVHVVGLCIKAQQKLNAEAL